jgi:hypothetical protein
MGMRLVPWLLLPIFAWACSDDPDVTPDAGAELDLGLVEDAGFEPDLGLVAYRHVPPPAAAVPAGLEGDRWRRHLDEDLLPYWRMTEAAGTPEGNFPTYRSMTGAIRGSTERRPECWRAKPTPTRWPT